jgi:predicted hydrocarbon binding protein
MHGILHKSLKNYVAENMGDDVWDEVMARADIDPKLYLPVSHYPDRELTDALAVIAEMSGHDEATVERDFGREAAPELLSTFKAHVRDDWTTLDLVENLPHIYDQIEAQNPETSPPDLDITRVTEDAVAIEYDSDRDLCTLGEGILVGVAAELDDDATVTHDTCQREGESHCEFHVELA